jgi:hypothetical protein
MSVPDTDRSLPSATDAWQVYCLCAAWCGLCGQWRTDFEALAAAHPGHAFTWIDIEDESDLVGDVDVETFPTLLIARGDEPLFFGPVTPHPTGVKRLLASLQGAAATAVSHPAPALLARLQRRA